MRGLSESRDTLEARPRGLSWSKLLTAARVALKNCEYEEAIVHCETALRSPHLRSDSEATIRCLLAEAFEGLAQFTNAVQAIHQYEKEQKREALSPLMQSQVCLRLGSAYGGTTEIPKAIAFAKQSLTSAIEQNDATAIAHSHIVLGTLYRRLGELWFARDHFSKVIKETLRHGNRNLVAQAYNGIGIVGFLVGDFSDARQAFHQAIEALGNADDPFMRGSIDINLATIAALQGQMHESVALFESAIPQLERARNPRLIVNAHSNLGYSLLRLGEVRRAEEILKESLSKARECEALLIEASTLETLGELNFLQGNFAEAETLLAQSLAILKELRGGFNHASAWLTFGRGQLLAHRPIQAAASFRESLEICERMGDPRGRAMAQLCLIEAHLALGEVSEAQTLLTQIMGDVERLEAINLIGHLREVSGSVALATHQRDEAIRYFNQAISIREVMGDRYRQGTSSYYLGQAHSQRGEVSAARKAFATARAIFQDLQAQPMLERTAQAMDEILAAQPGNETTGDLSEQIISVLTRLVEADFSRDVLLHEVVRILHDDFNCSPVIIFRAESDQRLLPLTFRGCTEQRASEVGGLVARQQMNLSEASVHRFEDKQETIWLYWERQRGGLPDSLLKLLIKQLGIGLERSARSLQPETPLLVAPVPELHPASVPGLIYHSGAMRKIIEQVLSLRSSDITVLITGETGTGKELIARAIHVFSKRAEHSFIPFNCAAAPRELLESQLFGHRRGAFTGATVDFPGLIGAAENGTLFLDEVGELPREMQPKLLRFLQNGEVQRLGETMPRSADVRIIAATNRDLEDMVATGDFRADLYYRLNVIQFRLPSLRERREEIPSLAEHFLKRFMLQSEKQGLTLSAEVLTLFRQYDWPGNARQLENEMQRLVALTPDGKKITTELLSPHIQNQTRLRLISPLTPPSSHQTLAEAVAETERHLLNDSLTRHKGNISRAAADLGVSRFGLHKMLQRHKILPQRKAK